MKPTLLGLLLVCIFSLGTKAQTKSGGLTEKERADFVKNYPIHRINVIKTDSLMWLTTDKYVDHRIFGYEKPDVKSKKMIAISIFTDDVEGNPFHCPYGAYYDINGNDLRLKYLAPAGSFIKVDVTLNKVHQGVVYISRRWVKFV